MDSSMNEVQRVFKSRREICDANLSSLDVFRITHESEKVIKIQYVIRIRKLCDACGCQAANRAMLVSSTMFGILAWMMFERGAFDWIQSIVFFILSVASITIFVKKFSQIQAQEKAAELFYEAELLFDEIMT